MAFDFEIHYCKELINLVDSLSYWPNYKPKGKDNNELLLSILQQKLQGMTVPRGPKTIESLIV